MKLPQFLLLLPFLKKLMVETSTEAFIKLASLWIKIEYGTGFRPSNFKASAVRSCNPTLIGPQHHPK